MIAAAELTLSDSTLQMLSFVKHLDDSKLTAANNSYRIELNFYQLNLCDSSLKLICSLPIIQSQPLNQPSRNRSRVLTLTREKPTVKSSELFEKSIAQNIVQSVHFCIGRAAIFEALH